MKNAMWVFNSLLVLAMAPINTTAFAQSRTRDVPVNIPAGRDERGREAAVSDEDLRRVSSRVSDLEDRLRRVEEYLERNGGGRDPRPGPGGPGPGGPSRLGAVCSLIDSAYSKTFLGKGASKLDAEFEVKKLCSASVNSVYCTGGKLKCDDVQPYAGATCVITDTAYSKMFRGSGDSTIEAEANARIECQKTVNAVYCAPAQARCETVRR